MGNPESPKLDEEPDLEGSGETPASDDERSVAPEQRKPGRLEALAWRLVPQRARPAVRKAAPYLGLFLLNLVFILPAVLPQLKRKAYMVLQPSGDLLVLVAVCVITAGMRRAHWVRRVATFFTFVLWLYWWDAFIGHSIVHQNPLFYDQLFLFKHVMVLVGDLWAWWMVLPLIVLALLLIAAVFYGRRLFIAVTDAIAARPRKQALVVLTIAYATAAAIMAVTSAMRDNRKHDPILWATTKIGDNLRRSYRMYKDLEAGMKESPYAGYVDEYPLVRKPDIHMFFVESYGAVLVEHPKTRPRWVRKTRLMQRELEDEGWHMVTGYSTAPISGGRSWLAEGTVLTGIVMRYEAVFRHVISKIHSTPNLVDYLDAQGYETYLLAPKARARRGVRLQNHYDYDQTIFALDLDYRGPAIGWGVVPDQYSLGYAQEHYYRKAQGPIFTNFHMVSSHAPWNTVPKILDDWELLGDPEGDDPFDDLPPEAEGQEVILRMKRFKRRDPRYLYMGEADGLKLKAYARAIAYDLDVIKKWLLQAEGDQIVVIMGDHQPPLLWEVTENNFDVPVHVLSRDSDLLEPFREQGFVDGLQLPKGELPAVGHEALFSLMVRTLARCCGEPGGPVPEVVRDGVQISE
jgi:hypothetical protein